MPVGIIDRSTRFCVIRQHRSSKSCALLAVTGPPFALPDDSIAAGGEAAEATRLRLFLGLMSGSRWPRAHITGSQARAGLCRTVASLHRRNRFFRQSNRQCCHLAGAGRGLIDS